MRRVFAGEAVVYEFKSITLKGRVCWMETHAVPLRDARGAVYALLGITRDITEHKWAEEQGRRHQTELARVARLSTMGEMATGWPTSSTSRSRRSPTSRAAASAGCAAATWRRAT
jgi:PAS domain-containing protein